MIFACAAGCGSSSIASRRSGRASATVPPVAGRFHIKSFGCQMNQHDAQKMANLLHHDGWSPAGDADAADLVVIHTCSIREKAEHKLYSELGRVLERKRAE